MDRKLVVSIIVLTALLGVLVVANALPVRTIAVKVTSFSTQISYEGPTSGYLTIISQKADTNSVNASSRFPDQLQFLFNLILQNGEPVPHQITAFTIPTHSFIIVSSDTTSLPLSMPKSGGMVSFTLVIRYEEPTDYTGPLTVQLSTE